MCFHLFIILLHRPFLPPPPSSHPSPSFILSLPPPPSSHPSFSSFSAYCLSWFCSVVWWLHNTGNSGGVLWWSLGTCLRQQLGILTCQGGVWRARVQQRWCFHIYFCWVRDVCLNMSVYTQYLQGGTVFLL